MNKLPKISESEWQVMKIIWQNPHCTANFVTDMLKDDSEWKPKTIKTLISRLLNKNVIGYEQDGRVYKYYPLVLETECIKEENKSFLNRVYNGSIKAMLANFIEDNDLTSDELAELRRILDERK